VSTTYDKGELEAISVLRLKAKRDQLRHRKAQIKRGVTSVTPQLRQEIDRINWEIKHVSDLIYQQTGVRE
jgi:hypothetical protein